MRAVRTAGTTLGALDEDGEREKIRPEDMTEAQAAFLSAMFHEEQLPAMARILRPSPHLRPLSSDDELDLGRAVTVAGMLAQLGEKELVELAVLIGDGGHYVPELPAPMQALVALVSGGPISQVNESLVDRAERAQLLYAGDSRITERAAREKLKDPTEAPPDPRHRRIMSLFRPNRISYSMTRDGKTKVVRSRI